MKKFMLIIVIIFISINTAHSANYKFQNTSGTTLMFINSTGGNVGIGTASPSNKLTVVGNINASTNISSPMICLNGVCQTSWPSGSGGFAVPGTVSAFAMSTCPTGWLMANGSNVSRTTYSELYNAIHTMYGVGDGSTTFGIPDYRGYFLRGVANGSNVDPDKSSRTDRGDGTGGDVIGSKQNYTVQSHAHLGGAETTKHAYTGDSYFAASSTSSTNTTGDNETRPVNIYVLYCIKAVTTADANGTINYGSTGAIAYYAANGTELSAATTINLNTTTNNIGIGTTAPTQRLDVNGSINVSSATGVYYGNGSGLFGVASSLTAGAATALASDPADCTANTWATTIATSGALTCSAVTYAGITAMTSANFASIISDKTGTAGYAVFSESPTFTGNIILPGGNWSTNGNVGIGTASPDALLTVAGDIKSDGSIVLKNLTSASAPAQGYAKLYYKIGSEETPDNYTKLLLHFDSDASGLGKNITVNGNPILNATAAANNSQAFKGAMQFDGTGDYLSIPDSDDWNLSNENFTIEAWAKFSAQPGNEDVLSIAGQWGAGQKSWRLGYYNNGGTYRLWWNPSTDGSTEINFYSSAWTATLNQWYHIAIVRNNGTIKAFVNGNEIGSQADTNTYFSSSAQLTIGNDYIGGVYEMNGALDELRISKDVARWTSNFTPDTSPYVNDSYTKLLLHFDADKSGSNHSVTFNGNTTFYSTVGANSSANFNGSLYFDGTGDYLSIPDSDDWDFGSGNFTIEAWVYPTRNTPAGEMQIIVAQDNSTDNRGWALRINEATDDFLFLYTTDGSTIQYFSSSWDPALNQWYHVAVVRNSSDLRFFVNGNQLGTTNNIGSATIASVNSFLTIGSKVGYSESFKGFIDELRISKGIARWTSNFTPPSSPHNVSTASETNKFYLQTSTGAETEIGGSSGSSGTVSDSDWTISGSNMYSGVSGNVGIGTTSPTQKLDVVGNVNVSGTLYASNISSNSPLQLQTAGVTRMYINDTTGNVGIGTTSPTQNLDVNGSINISSSSGKLYVPEICLNGDCETAWSGGGGFAVPGTVSAFAMSTCPAGWLMANGSEVSRTTYSELYNAIGIMYGNTSSSTFTLPDYRGYFLRGLANGSTIDPDKASRTTRGDGTTGDAVGTKQTNQTSSHLHAADPPSTASGTESATHYHAADPPSTTSDSKQPTITIANSGAITTYPSGSMVIGTSYVPEAFGGTNYGLAVTASQAAHTHDTNIASFNSGTESATHTHTTDIASFNSVATGGSETRPVNIYVLYCIKAVTTSDAEGTINSGTTGALAYYAANGDDLTATTAIYLNATTGNVGIGTTLPTQKLDVVGNISINGTGYGIKFPDGSFQTSAPGNSSFVLVSNTGTNIGDLTSAGGLAAAFDGDITQTDSECAVKASSTLGYVGKDFGSGNNTRITKWEVWGSTNACYNNPAVNSRAYLSLQYSDDNSNWTTVDTFVTFNWCPSNGEPYESTVFGLSGHRYWRVYLQGAGGDVRLGELKLYTGGY